MLLATASAESTGRMRGRLVCGAYRPEILSGQLLRGFQFPERRPEAGSGARAIIDSKLFIQRRFYLVLILIGITIITGAATGFGLFYRLSYILGLTLILSFIWNLVSISSLEVEVERRTRRVRVGDDVEERITVRNRSNLPKPTLEVEDITNLPSYSSGMAISLPVKGFRSWRTSTPARKRGVYTLGPVQVVNSDAFGIFKRERNFGGTGSLVVYPRTHQIPEFAIPAADLSGDSSTRRRSHDLTPHASSVREYAFGDSISRVHWNSTAKLGKLMSKEFDLGQSSDVWILVDWPKPTLEVEDITNLPSYSSGMAISLPVKGFRSWRTSTPARKRGVYTLGPVQVVNSDAFGIFKRERNFGGTGSLVVYPRTHQIPEFAIPAADLSGDSSTRRRSHDLTPHASSVREYAFGDSISRVHWNSTAKLGKLMSKEFDLGQSSDVWILVDLHRDVQAGELEESTDEYAVSIAASLAKKYLEANLPVGLIAYGDKRYFLPADVGLGQFDRIMEFLAMSTAEGSTPLESVLPREEQLWGYHSTLIVVTPSNRPDWALAAKELGRRRVRVGCDFVGWRFLRGVLQYPRSGSTSVRGRGIAIPC